MDGAACVVDVGGGVSVSAFCRLSDGIIREGNIKQLRFEPTNELFARYEGDALMMAQTIGARVQLAVMNALKMTEWAEVEAAKALISVMQTGEMRNVYFG